MLYTLFPNTVLTYTQDHCGVFTSFPITPDESVISFSVLVDPGGEGQEARELLEGQRDLFANALVEDLGIGETIQTNFSSGANQPADLRQVREGAGLVPRREVAAAVE